MTAQGLELPPFAPFLMQSLRAVGYSLQAALADLIDNSIAGHAKHIDIEFDFTGNGYVATIDDGEGMTPSDLVSAMRFGSRDPRDARTDSDLGRFGLGLKTASLSQCRRFTIVSLQSRQWSVARWDLDECERKGVWWLERPDVSEIPRPVLEKLSGLGHGSAVVWQELDRLLPAGVDSARLANRMIEDAAEHLALTYHRYIAGEIVGEFVIRLNGRSLPDLDPFLEGHARGQSLHSEVFTVEGHEVRISPFVLPFPSRMKQAELDRAGGRESLKSGHGFYVYRGGRLVVPGGWFRIVPSDDLVRLARVRVDVPVELDHLWRVDIRKASAEPPIALRSHLRRIVSDVTARSRRVYSHRGTPRHDLARIPLWLRKDGRDGAASWVVNRNHPAVAGLTTGQNGVDDVARLLRLLEEALPVHEIHLHIANDLPVVDFGAPSYQELELLAENIAVAFTGKPDMLRSVLESLHITCPFDRDPESAKRIAERLLAR